MNKAFVVASYVLALLAAAACTPTEQAQEQSEETALRGVVGTFEEIDSPAGDGAGQPFVVAGMDDSFLLSWTEPDARGDALKMARYSDGTWSEASVISARDDFFVNWADFPSIALSGDSIYAHWLQRSAPGTYDYDVYVSISRDGGRVWGDPFVVHDDGTKAEHGFASFLPLPDSRVGITWLDGREMAGHDEGDGDMTLRYAEIGPDGSITNGALLDSRTCECCTTTITSTPDGPLVAWRDRSETEIRDISLARFENGVWTDPVSLHEDGWEINGCPVNGPQSDSAGDRIVIAWFSAANESNVINSAFSDDGGRTFDPPVALAQGERVFGYLDVVMVDDDRAFVVWMEDNGTRLDLVGREVSASGAMSEPTVVASTSRGRTGFPRLAKSGEQILLSWNEKGETPRIHTALAAISKERRTDETN